MRLTPLSLMEFAEWPLIISTNLKCYESVRLSHSRSYLSCHHVMIA